MDILSLFARPEYLAAGAALISVPIIIHLINRMRFKRLRWAAMEFLLKAQKRSRRRLIIEQLILLLLRCLLVALAALLVLRLTGCTALGSKEELHIVVIDDTLSMTDRHKDRKGAEETCFSVARERLLKDGILKNLSQSSSNDRLALVQLSRVATEPDYQPAVFERLNEQAGYARASAAIEAMKPSKLHVPLVEGVKQARELAARHPDKNVTIHVLSDFRETDWVKGESVAPLREALLTASRGEHPLQVRLWDSAHPFREAREDAPPAAHKNVGITDMRANTRITGRGMPVTFTVEVANYGPQDTEVKVKIFDDLTGSERFDVTFNERQGVLKVPSKGTATCSFTLAFSPELKDNEVHHAQLSARLLNAIDQPLEDDGLLGDNIRHVAVEVRNRVPILVIDGRGIEGRKEGGDSYHVKLALESPQNSRYDVVFADQLTGGNGREALESPGLQQFATILLLNVPSLTPRQAAGLETYVRQGGGVGFYMGPDVNAASYNERLFKKGKGLFPVALKEDYYPKKGQPELKPQKFGREQILLRDDEFKNEKVPVFGAIFVQPKLRGLLKFLPVGRYFPVAAPGEEPRAEEGKEEKAKDEKDKEKKEKEREARRPRVVVSLPNDSPLIDQGGRPTELAIAALDLANKLPVADEEYKAYHLNLLRHRKAILNAPNSGMRASELADLINALLKDRGDDKDYGNLEEFWKISDPKVSELSAEAQKLRDRLMYGDPIMVTGRHGQGRVLVTLTTADNAWNGWASLELFPNIIWEMQNYLSSQAGEPSRLVGEPLRLTVDRRRFGNKALRASTYFYRTELNKKAEFVALETGKSKDTEPAAAAAKGKGNAKGNGQPADDKGQVPGNGQDGDKEEKQDKVAEHLDTFTFRKTLEPGLYVTYLRAEGDDEGSRPLLVQPTVFNVPTEKEGRLARASKAKLDSEFLREAAEAIKGPLGPRSEELYKPGKRPQSPTESPWFFLIFLGILIAEQALAVHLSFHLRGAEADLPSQAVHPHAAKAA
jgi:hypothetical protein